MHIRAYSCQVFEEHTSRKLRCLIIQTVDCKPDAGTLVVVTVSLIQADQILHVKLVLKDGSKVDHESILGSGFDDTTACLRVVAELHGLHLGGILNELMHEPYKMITRLVYIFIYLLCDRRIV